MKNRASSHILVLLIIVFLTFIAHYSIYYGALIRGYETSWISAGRNIGLIGVLAVLPILLSALTKFKGNWTLYTAAVLMFSLGLVGQYRLFSDKEYISKKEKSQARQAKLETLQLHYIQENYSAEKKQMMGLPPTEPSPVDLSKEKPRPANDSITDNILSGNTLIPLFSIFAMVFVYLACRRDDVVKLLQANGFLLVLLTLVPLIGAALLSKAGKFFGNMTPWEPAKIPFLLGFAAILSVLYRNLAKTYWGVPKFRDVLPLVVMAVMPFVPFFVLKDFGQMMVFSSVYATLYLIAIKKLPQRIVLVGSVLFFVSILVVGALPIETQSKVPLLPTIAKPVKAILPDRIQQRFHLWLDGFTPPTPDTDWWKKDYDKYYADLVKTNPELPAVLEEEALEGKDNLQKSINIDAWFDILAFQPAQATFGLASGGTTGRGLGLGYPELIPVADSDYIYSAIGEELGLFGGLLIIFALLIFVGAGVRTADESRDMFGKLCSAGLTAFIGFQALVNIGGITRALPMTGITLPFISHGGFSLLTSFAMLGMLLAFSHRNAVDATTMNNLGESI
jgi:cell division protein FtsW (lipid II flippase)